MGKNKLRNRPVVTMTFLKAEDLPYLGEMIQDFIRTYPRKRSSERHLEMEIPGVGIVAADIRATKDGHLVCNQTGATP